MINSREWVICTKCGHIWETYHIKGYDDKCQKCSMSYYGQLEKAMIWLGKQPNTIFLGQTVEYPGTGMHKSFESIPSDKKLELPVAEEMQMGMSIGLALQGYVPISVYPRWNFLLLATNQLVNHLDKLPLMSDWGYTPKVIIRTAVGSINPLDPQHQHKYNFSGAFRHMLYTVRVVELYSKEQIFTAYQDAYNRPGSVILVEMPDVYNS